MNDSELQLIPNQHLIDYVCSQCQITTNIRADSLRANIKRNERYICIKCVNLKTKPTRPERKPTPINCSKCSKQLTVARASINKNKRKHDGQYVCGPCARTSIITKPSQKTKQSTWQLNPEIKSRFKAIMTSDIVKEKISKASKRKWENQDYASKVTVALAERHGPSSIELALYKILDAFDIKYHKESKETCFGKWSFDCLIPKQNKMHKHLLIECQGDYFHELSKKQTADRQKFTFIDRYFPDHEIMYLWEHEFLVESRIVDRLKLKLGINVLTADFEFSDLTVKICSHDDCKKFLDAYHYIGGRRSGIAVGCYHGETLIAVAMYSKPVRQNVDFSQQYRELSRFCIHPSYHKKNLASWFLSRTYKFVDVNLLVSYADSTVGHDGAMYKASNWRFSHDVRQDYWYIDDRNRILRKKAVYDHAIKCGMTENEFVEKHKYVKKWGGVKKCFTMVVKL